MANQVRGQALGGQAQEYNNVDTVGDLRKKMNLSGASYTATVNGEPADDCDELEDYQFVTFAPAVKGGMAA